MPHDLMVHMVDYVSTSNSRIGGDDPHEQQDIICITIRPDRNSHRPHNIGLPKSQAQRLLLDLQKLLTTTPLLLLLSLATGCSARVEVTSEPSSPVTSTVVAVDVLAEREGPVVVNVAGDFHVHLHQVPERILPSPNR